MTPAPIAIESIGNEIALSWPDGREDFLPHAYLREHSPSADNIGERDIFGNRYGGHDNPRNFSAIAVTGWERVGNYAVAFLFSDGHRSGIFAWDYLRHLADKLRESQP